MRRTSRRAIRSGTRRAGARAGTPETQPARAFPGAVWLLIFITAAALFPVTGNGFIWDDKVVHHNPLLDSTAGLRAIWLHPGGMLPFEIHYWPVPHTMFWLLHHVFGDDPMGYHAVSILLHLANTLLLLALLRRWRIPGAGLAALVFGIHPVHVESVAWIAEYKDLLFTLFYLSALLMFTKHEADGAWRRYLAGTVFFILGLLSKSMAVTLPVVLLLLSSRQPHGRGKRFWKIAPLLAMAGVFALLDTRLARGLETYHSGLTPGQRILLCAANLTAQLSRFFFPVRLNAVYPRVIPRWSDPHALVPPVLLIAGGWCLWRYRRALGIPVVYGMIFFAVTLFPTLGCIDFGFMRYAFIADRFQYLPLAGAAVAVAALAARACHERKRCLAVAAVSVTLLLSPLTWRRAGVFRNRLTLFRDALEKNPDAYIAHYNIAAALAESGDIPGAIRHYQAVQRLHPGHGDTEFQLGTWLMKTGRYREAQAHLEAYARAHPEHVNSRINLGNVNLHQGNLRAAERWYREALKRAPGNPLANNNLGFCLMQTGKLDAAERCFLAALRVSPGDRDANLNIARLYLQRGDGARAAEHFRRVLAADPDNVEAANNLAWWLATAPEPRRNPEEAIRWAIRANTATRYENPSCLDTLSRAYAAAGRYREALDVARNALEHLDPGADLAREIQDNIRVFTAKIHPENRGNNDL